ncbi:alpha/beta hydrolase [Microbulbifer sp. TYP-18]|uniref:alpha/beta hydrolase n=1 Tax=Microbulbifer sp. TYP-18 TaxID=3230024 RepID=UPI0034C6B226
MTWMRWLGTVVAMLYGSLSQVVWSEAVDSRDCYLDGWRSALKCSRLTVGEGVTKVDLAVMVAPAVNEVGRAPLYLLAGGPGQAASDLAPLLNLFDRINRERAIVLVDRRGAGRSEPLDCGWKLDPPDDLEVFSAQLADCYLQQKDFANSLSSRQEVDDLERVRQYLGHTKIALWGVSWGSRTALLYQQWYPESLSSLVLDAVAPIDVKVFLAATAAEQALRKLERDCSGDPACARLGDWRADLDQLQQDWDNDTRRFPDPYTGVLTGEPVPRWILLNIIRGALYLPETAAQLPYAIKQAGSGNYRPLAAIEGVLRGNNMSLGLTFSVACAEELSRTSDEEVASDSADTFLGTAYVALFERGCRVWPVAERPYPQPESRSHPVLLISGEADPITPPVYADTHLDYLTDKQHLVVAGGGHSNSARGCIPELIERFLKAPETPLDPGCVEEIQRPPFMVDKFGPELGAQRGEAGEQMEIGGRGSDPG